MRRFCYHMAVKLKADVEGERLDRFLSRTLPEYSRKQLMKLIRDGAIRVNGLLSKPSFQLRPGDTVDAVLPRPARVEVRPTELPLNVLHEDGHIVVIEKPAGLLAHPTQHESRQTVVSALLAKYSALPSLAGPEEAGLVHRLDRDVSGVMVCGRTEEALRSLDAQFRARTVEKIYTALVKGVPKQKVIEAPLIEARREWKVRVSKHGKPAKTTLRVVKTRGDRSLVEVHPLTGRSHQIRVHLASIGCPIFGDALYGGPKFPRLALHAWKISFEHPATGERVEFVSKLPKEMLL